MNYLRGLKTRLFSEITTVPEIVKESYYPSLGGLRAIAILLVLLYHFGANRFLKPFNMRINGDFGVDIFFIISGFLITTLLLKEKLKYGKISLRRFYTRRALRVIPAAYVFLLVLIILKAYFGFRISEKGLMASFLFYKNLPFQEDFYSGHFWTLAAEVQFYLISPFLLTLNINRYLVLVLSIVILVPVISIVGYYDNQFVNGNSFIHLITRIVMYIFWKGPFIILIGSLCSVFLFKGIIRIEKSKVNYFLSFLLLAVAITISSTSFLFYTKYVSEFISAVLVAFVILFNLSKKGFLSVILESWILTRIGILSYSLYVWQQLFSGNRLWQPWLKPFSFCSHGELMIVKFAMVTILAFISYYLIEVRFLKMKTRFE